jgi:hypothetical protein
MPCHGILLLRRMGAVGKDVRRSAFGGAVRSLAILCVSHNQRLKMEMTKKEVRPSLSLTSCESGDSTLRQ